MNFRYSILPIAMLFCFHSNLLQAQTVVDYYKLLADYDDDIKLHAIYQEGNQWYTDGADNTKRAITVDETNNYLELKDKEFNGIFTLEVSVLEKADGEKLVAVVKNHLDIFLHGEIHILKFRNGRWSDVTESVMPNLTYKDFTEESLSLAASTFDPALNHHLEFGFQLPKEGSTVLALMQTQILKERCANGDNSVKDYCASLHEISYSSINLNWDTKNGKFVIGKRQ